MGENLNRNQFYTSPISFVHFTRENKIVTNWNNEYMYGIAFYVLTKLAGIVAVRSCRALWRHTINNCTDCNRQIEKCECVYAFNDNVNGDDKQCFINSVIDNVATAFLGDKYEFYVLITYIYSFCQQWRYFDSLILLIVPATALLAVCIRSEKLVDKCICEQLSGIFCPIYL